MMQFSARIPAAALSKIVRKRTVYFRNFHGLRDARRFNVESHLPERVQFSADFEIHGQTCPGLQNRYRANLPKKPAGGGDERNDGKAEHGNLSSRPPWAIKQQRERSIE